jgi:RHS repeat-associated protein
VQEGQPSQRNPYLFTSKELDEETGLYYFGARYYDPRTSLWVIADPALGEYLPNLADRIDSGNRGTKYEPERTLPGYGGVYRATNLALFSYSSLRPLVWADPNGMWSFAPEYKDSSQGLQPSILKLEGTVDTAFQKVAGRDAIITFATKGEHSPGSLHYVGQAIDLRTRDLSTEQKVEVAELLQEAVGSDFDVVTEGSHIHVEYQPKQGEKSGAQGSSRLLEGFGQGPVPMKPTQEDMMNAFEKFGKYGD